MVLRYQEIDLDPRFHDLPESIVVACKYPAEGFALMYVGLPISFTNMKNEAPRRRK